MALTQEDVIRRWARDWRNLAAWRAPLPAIVALEKWKGSGKLGVAHCHERRAVIYQTGDLVEDLSTVLHELAHLAAPMPTSRSEIHGLEWRGMFASAAVEACNLRPEALYEFDLSVNVAELDQMVCSAVQLWLATSGQRDVLRAIGVLS